MDGGKFLEKDKTHCHPVSLVLFFYFYFCKGRSRLCTFFFPFQYNPLRLLGLFIYQAMLIGVHGQTKKNIGLIWTIFHLLTFDVPLSGTSAIYLISSLGGLCINKLKHNFSPYLAQTRTPKNKKKNKKKRA